MSSYSPRQEQILELLQTNGELSRSQIAQALGGTITPRTIVRDIDALIEQGQLKRIGSARDTRYSLAAPETIQPPLETPIITPLESKPSLLDNIITTADMKPQPGDAPPIVDIKVNNPLTFFIRWWKRVISNEGITIKVKPLTAIILTIIIVGLTTGGYGLAGILWFVNKTPLKNTPLIEYIPQPNATPNPWRQTAFIGTLRSNARGFAFLTTTEGEGITLQLPSNVNLDPYINRRILATGLYNESTHTMQIPSASDIELLPWYAEAIPTTPPTPIPITTPFPTSQPNQTICTMDAKLCPDGSAVGRTGPNCTFAPCPGE